MKTIRILVTVALQLLSLVVYGQLDSIQALPEVQLSATRLRDYNQGTIIQTIAPEIAQTAVGTLTQTLRENSVIYFRENGLGGVSSASFRGTNAQQTAVVWNGININSALTGQTDFNTITGQLYDEIAVRHGGASTAFGTGAVGGSVHLKNDIRFGQSNNKQLIQLGYGSFGTSSGLFKSTLSRKRVYIDAGLSYTDSANDYDYPGTDLRNENGAFTYKNFQLTAGYKLDDRNALHVYHNSFLGDREFAGTLTAVSDDAYEDRTSRTLLEYAHKGRLKSTLRAAHIYEQYRYFPTENDLDIYDQGKVIRFTAQYEGSYAIDNSKKVQLLADITTATASGSNITPETRNSGTLTGLYKQQLGERFLYNVQLRQEFSNAYANATVYAMGASYDVIKETPIENKLTYTTLFSASKNYRVPSFNDTSWQGAGALGNPEIRPETSYQAELGHRFKFKAITLEATSFYIASQDLIVWRPGNNGIWSPINISEARNYGAEILLTATKRFAEHKLELNGSYSYNIAEDADSGNSLIYVPKHNFKSNLRWTYKKLGATAQFLATSNVFYTSDGNNSVDGYGIANLGVQYQLIAQGKNRLELQLRAQNFLNTDYQIINARPMPGRNFLVQTQYTF